MGMFDSVFVDCPKCRTRQELQSKAGECTLREYDIYGAPLRILADLADNNPHLCDHCRHEIYVVLGTSVRIF